MIVMLTGWRGSTVRLHSSSIIGTIHCFYLGLSFSVTIAHTPAVRSLGRVEIGQDIMRNDIFNPVLTEIFSDLYKHLKNESAKVLQRYLILSGVLAECPYVHSFIHAKLESFQDTSDIITIATRNELVPPFYVLIQIAHTN